MLVEFGKASLFQKARSHPDRVREVLAKIKVEGLLPTIESVFRKLDEPLPLGYCNSGVVIGLGDGTSGFAIGDRVVSNGPHAEIVSVPINLCAAIPKEVSDDLSAFTPIAAIGLQGIRLLKPEFGETVVVIGLGLVGQITAQLLRAAGCSVIGFDSDPSKTKVAASLGLHAMTNSGDFDPVRHVLDATDGLGADAVAITASTSSNSVVSQSAKMARKRGRLVLIGTVGLGLSRPDFYEKELTFQVSCSYGPGRYDDTYENKGYDYPPAYVRWTENRNFRAVLEAMRTGRLQVDPLVTRRVQLEDFHEIYDGLDGGMLGSLLIYRDGPGPPGGGPHVGEPVAGGMTPTMPAQAADRTISVSIQRAGDLGGALALVGTGNYAKMTALPSLIQAGALIRTLVSASGVSSSALARKYSVPFSSTDFDAVLHDSEISGVIIATRHHLHATQVVAALKARKHVLVEKPLCLSLEELRAVDEILNPKAPLVDDRVPEAEGRPTLTVGFNRRFSPHSVKIKTLLENTPGPVSIVATMNVGSLPPSHWVHDRLVGGGRIIGEACHYVDLAIFLTGSLIEAVSAVSTGDSADTASIMLRHVNGSSTVINYFSNGHREAGKERIEVYAAGRTLRLDDFIELRGYGFKSFSRLKTKQDKGHAQQFALFSRRIRTGVGRPIPWNEIANSAIATLAIPRAIADRRWILLSEFVS